MQHYLSQRARFIAFCSALGLIILLCAPSILQAQDTADKAAQPVAEANIATATPFTEKDVLAYLEQALAWQKDAHSSQPVNGTAREVLLVDALHQNATSALSSIFDFSRAQAVMIDKATEAAKTAKAEEKATDEKPAPATTETTAAAQTEAKPDDAKSENVTPDELVKFSAAVEAHLTQLQTQLNTINSRLRAAPARTRASLTAQREKLEGEINLAHAQRDLLSTIEQTVADTSDANIGALLKKINNLARSVPGLDTTATNDTAAAKPVTPKGTATIDPDTAEAAADTQANTDDAVANRGLVQLVSDIFSIMRKKSDLATLRQQAKDLRTGSKEMRTALRTALQNIGKQGNAFNQGPQADVKTLEQQRTDLDILTTNFRQLSLSVVPLSQAYTALDTSYRTLKEWQSLLDDNFNRALRKLITSLVILSVALLIPVIISEFAKRMIVRYVHDTRRQRQLRILRRSILGVTLLLIVIFNLTSELGSLATFAGFLTAGLAVALQNVLLSLVAHFFFFGRNGVRNGDRVTVGGVTGDVTQVGMVRLYLAEVTGEGEDATPTGRIVAFPNSILFQPTAFYKHLR